MILLNALFEGKGEGWNVQGTLKVIDEFARFCFLLSHPDNHVYAQSGQYTKQLVPLRQVKDMTDEIAQELGNLPKYTAYAKVLQERNGEQIVLKRKIRTLPPLKQDKTTHAHIEREALARTHAAHCTERDRIDEELRQRHESWRQAEAQRASKRVKRRELPHLHKTPEAEEPPPTLS